MLAEILVSKVFGAFPNNEALKNIPPYFGLENARAQIGEIFLRDSDKRDVSSGQLLTFTLPLKPSRYPWKYESSGSG
jgi:hypothetical protein